MPGGTAAQKGSSGVENRDSSCKATVPRTSATRDQGYFCQYRVDPQEEHVVLQVHQQQHLASPDRSSRPPSMCFTAAETRDAIGLCSLSATISPSTALSTGGSDCTRSRAASSCSAAESGNRPASMTISAGCHSSGISSVARTCAAVASRASTKSTPRLHSETSDPGHHGCRPFAATGLRSQGHCAIHRASSTATAAAWSHGSIKPWTALDAPHHLRAWHAAGSARPKARNEVPLLLDRAHAHACIS